MGFVLAALSLAGSAWAGQVRSLVLELGATGTRAEVALQGTGQYKTLSLAGPDRLVLDLSDSQAARGLKLPAPAGVVTAVRTGQPVPGTLRIVFELSAPVAAWVRSTRWATAPAITTHSARSCWAGSSRESSARGSRS